jgi:hypothetical protein
MVPPVERTEFTDLREEVRDGFKEVKALMREQRAEQGEQTREITALKVQLAGVCAANKDRDAAWRRLLPWIVAALVSGGGVAGGSLLSGSQPDEQRLTPAVREHHKTVEEF